MKSHRRQRKLKNRKHQILLSRKNVRKRHIKKLTALSKKRDQTIFQPLEGKYIQRQQKTSGIYSIYDKQTGSTVDPQLLLEYSSLYPNKNFNIENEIKNFSRDFLIQIVLTLGKVYDTCKVSDLKKNFFFSYDTSETRTIFNLINRFANEKGYKPEYMSYASSRTFLEFLKFIYSIDPQKCSNQYDDYLGEIKIFNLLLAINEQKVTPFTRSQHHTGDLAYLSYANLYATSEFANFKEALSSAEQMYYANTFFTFLTSRKEYDEIYKYFLDKYNIDSWKEYYRSIIILIALSFKNGEGYYNFDIEGSDYKINTNVLDEISIHDDAYIESNEAKGDENRDFATFRGHPLIKTKDNRYLIFSKPLLINRLYNSIYFDFLNSGLKYKKKSISSFFQEIFVEKYLFDHTVANCIKDRQYKTVFPSLENIFKDDFVDQKEVTDQPDFYYREDNNAFIFECKAIKLNGLLKKEVDIDEIFDNLQNKLSTVRWKIQDGEKKQVSPKEIGVGQLVNHIERLENNTFSYEKEPNNNLIYYPILVLESSEIVKPQLSEITNRWYQEKIDCKTTIDIKKCKPLIVMTIKTLFLFDSYFKQDGFKYYFDKFISSHILPGSEPYNYAMNIFEDFDCWMQSNYTTNKTSDFITMIEKCKSPANSGVEVAL